MSSRGRQSADGVLILALAAGKTAKESAVLCNVSEKTVGRRLADPEFEAKVADARAAMSREALGRLADTLTEAADALRDLVKPGGDPRVRIRAATAVLDQFVRLGDAVDVRDRLAEVERFVVAAKARSNDPAH